MGKISPFYFHRWCVLLSVAVFQIWINCVLPDSLLNPDPVAEFIGPDWGDKVVVRVRQTTWPLRKLYAGVEFFPQSGIYEFGYWSSLRKMGKFRFLKIQMWGIRTACNSRPSLLASCRSRKMGSRPVITIQCGNYANYVGAHFWNIQALPLAARK